MGLLLAFAVLLPGAAFLLLGLAWLLGIPWRERMLARATTAIFSASALALAILAVNMIDSGTDRVTAGLGVWFQVGGYHFPLQLAADAVSLPMLLLTAILTGLVTLFSARYMHREPDFTYFFLLLQLFGFGSLLLFAASSFDLLIAGWEFVGITSVLLIAYFHRRREPVRNGIYVFGVYRTCDLGLLLGVVLLHHFAGSAEMAQTGRVSGTPALLAGLLFLFAAAGKAAQFPFSGWLPRAMEGPTPSSAIFYGAISVHAGAYLLLRSAPLLEHSVWVQAATIALGVFSAAFGVLCGRACADVKSALAYASIAQLGVIFVEIGLGLHTFALWHICGHAIVRTLQFLRAPSALHEFHQMHAAAGGHLEQYGQHHEALLPLRARLWLYRFALERAYMDAILERLVVRPVSLLSSKLNPREELKSSSPKEQKGVAQSAIAGEADA